MMAEGFSESNVLKTFEFKATDVDKQSDESSDTIRIEILKNENLFDYKYNTEDIENTLDLENSIRELGFIDPLEVTDFFDVGEGNYTIISGHRRRSAGVKVNIDRFPCIIKSFKSEKEVQNYILLSNSYRDSSKDPLLYCKRYKAHEAYLKEMGFKGSLKEEIAKRLGISSRQAERYNQFNKIISPVWDLVRDGTVGMSNVLGMSVYGNVDQKGILDILTNCIENGDKLTRESCEKIIKGFKVSKKDNGDSQNIKVKRSFVTKIFDFNDNKGETKDKLGENNILIALDRFEKVLDEDHVFSNKESALNAINKLQILRKTLLIEIEKINKMYGLEENNNE